ncbi:MAG TPA: hypothetical protein VF657_16150 [Actinoplanes sp.]
MTSGASRRHPRPGDVLKLTAQASVQFIGSGALTMRVISIDSRTTYVGWAWLTGYVLDTHGNAVERREVFVQEAGLIWVDPASL